MILTPWQKLEQAIAIDPQDVVNYLEFAELLIKTKQFGAVESVLRRGISACGNQPTLVQQLQYVHQLQAAQDANSIEKRAVEMRDDDMLQRISLLEVALALAVLLLILQMVPSASEVLLSIVDFSSLVASNMVCA